MAPSLAWLACAYEAGIDTAAHGVLTLACVRAMPPAFQDYLSAHGMDTARIITAAERPDRSLHDNIAHFGDKLSSNGWYHSHKLVRDQRGRLRHLGGSVRTPIQAAPWLVLRALAPEQPGTPEDVPELLMEVSHYTVDACTVVHVSREFTPEEHRYFEQVVADQLPHLIPDHIEPLPLPCRRDLGASVPFVCRQVYLSQVGRLRQALDEHTLPAQPELLRDSVSLCVRFTVAVWGELWDEITARGKHLPNASR